MDLQKFYYEISFQNPTICWPKNSHHENLSLHHSDPTKKAYELILKRRTLIRSYSNELSFFRPVLLESLTKIYFHPEISSLLTLVKTEPFIKDFPKKLFVMFSGIMITNIHREFPFGDNHDELMNQFISEFIASKLHHRSPHERF